MNANIEASKIADKRYYELMNFSSGKLTKSGIFCCLLSVFYEPMLSNTIKQIPKVHRFFLLAVTLFVVTILVLPASNPSANVLPVVELEPGTEYTLELPIFANLENDQSEQIDEQYTSYKVKSGDTLARIFSAHSLSARTTFEVSNAGAEAKRLKSIKPGDKIDLRINDEGELVSLRYPINKTSTLLISDENGTFTSTIIDKQVDKALAFAQGIISSSFWNAGTNAGISDNKIMELAGIFGWDIDFAQEIRSGDSFNMAYEMLYVNGEFVGFGDIVAAEFVNQGEVFTAIRHTDGNYYTPSGESMRKSFLRAPINFRYVSSNFDPKRLHPVQKRIKPHRGVDYVAKVGTPVVAAGDGKVIRSGYNRFNGNYVFIQHGEKYVTKYLHFKRRAVKKGQTVKQGQTIGYLGRTGMVTGAHLHYEFLVDGVHRNPRTVELPSADPINPQEKEAFLEMAAVQQDLLNNNKRIMLAKR